MNLFPFLTEAVTPWHAVRALSRRLTEAGFTALDEADEWNLGTGGYFTVRGGALAAWVAGKPARGWTIAAAHTDSPGWRLKLMSRKAQKSV